MSKPDLEDLTKKEFDSWTVLGPAPKQFNKKMWKCQCRCGKRRDISGSRLKHGRTKHCLGCANATKAMTHGHAGAKKRNYRSTSAYASWATMNKCHEDVVSQWRGKGGFIAFFEDMGDKPQPAHTFGLFRKDVNRPFSKDNCYWKKFRNKNTKTYEIDGVRHTLSELAWIYEINRSTLAARTRSGLTAKEAVSIPISPNVIVLTAFGETKSRSQWLSDPRCKVGIAVLRKRLTNGWDHQKAISTPCKRP